MANPSSEPPRVAVLDLGTNSTRLLVAEVHAGAVRELDRRTEITRLGQGVDASGRLEDGAMERVYEVLEGFRAVIDELGAGETVAVATSAVRDAANGDEFRAILRERYGIEARTLSGDEEARLTFRGATSVIASQSNAEPTLVIDIGGGSTELVVGRPGEDPSFHVSTQSGAVRQTERHLDNDPPEPRSLSDLALEVQLIVEEAVPEEVRAGVGQGIAVAGTATSLAAVDQELEPYDPARVDGYRLGLGACERMLAMLAGKTIAERREVPGLHPGRAPTIVAGAVILVEVMRAFGLDAVRTSEADILHGAALSAAG
jgi:exopolyphosphatase/guanosine-5'-triphosphate,3'-diphosphate pyrophosphatase